MPLESIEVSTVLPASAERIYRAWLDSAEHSAFTGGQAVVDATVGGRHTAWDGYIEGVTLELDPGKRIVQSWRSEDFPDDSDDSRLEIRFEEGMDGTRVTIVHTEIPEGQGEDYRRGWVDHYFAPMARYFGAAPAAETPAAAAVTAAPSEDLSAAWADDEATPASFESEAEAATPAPMRETVSFEETIEEIEEAPAPKAKPAAAKKPKAAAKKPAKKPVVKAKAAKKPAAKAKAAAKTKKAAKKPAAKPKAKAKKPAAKAKKPAAKAKKPAKKKGKR